MNQSTPEERHDLTGTFPENPQDGEHLLHTTPDGVKLLATFKGGKVIEWRGTDNHGQELQTFTRWNPPKCEVCVIRPRAIVSWWVPCQVAAT